MKLLIIRFSSFGDIAQAIAVPRSFVDAHPGATVDWLTRSDFVGLLSQQPSITRVISYSRDDGLLALLHLAFSLASNGYTHVYDAHSNLRSSLVMAVFRVVQIFRFVIGRPLKLASRPKNRLRRFLFFKFRRPTLPRPFRGADSYHRPLLSWGLPATVPSGQQFHLKEIDLPNYVVSDLLRLRERFDSVVTLAPSAAWEMKRWPVEHWKKLLTEISESAFLLLGGKEDAFLEELSAIDPSRILNLAGRLTLEQSAAILLQSDLVIANDTGLLHVADQMERPTIALIGPTAFGYPSHSTSVFLERPLFCQPCSKDGRGGCLNSLYKRCLVELSPALVILEAQKILSRVEVRG